jgi:hypothetical protein
MVDEALPGIKEYIEKEGPRLDKQIADYRELAKKEGRICQRCGRANKVKDFCPSCNRTRNS